MKGMCVALVLAGAPVFAQPPDVPPQDAQPAGPRATVTGVVTTWPTGAPASGAVVKLVNEAPSTAPPGRQTQSTTTAADGSFRLDGVAPRQYWVVANLAGFLPAEYGQRSPTGVGVPFDAAPGQRVSVRLSMWPTSGISGRVTDVDGDPVGRAQVLALRVVYRDGKPSLTIAETVITDDRGEYRMFWLAPGSYRVAARGWDPESSAPLVNIAPPRRFGTAEQATSPVVSRRTRADGTTVDEADVPVYAPATTDPQLASTVNLSPGENAGDVDIQLVGNRVRAYHVRGVVAGSGTIGPGRRVPVMLVPRSLSPFATIASGLPGNDGAFDIRGVAPGSYFLYSQDSETVQQQVDVADGDVDVTLTFGALLSLAGRMTFDRGVTAAAVPVDASELQIMLARDPDFLGSPNGGPRFNRPPTPDGTITLDSIPPGDYRVVLRPFLNRDDTTTGRPVSDSMRNAYVKSITLGSTDVLANGLHLWGPTTEHFDIVIGLNGAHAEGTATSGRDPAPGVTIVAVPDGASRGRPDLYRKATTDRQGRFSIEGLAPGDYTFYAWDDIERGAWESPEFMRAFEGRGRFVRLGEGKNDAIELSVVTGR